LNQPLRIMIAEDDPLLAQALGELLAAVGHSICAIAYRAQEAIDTARDCKPDLVLVDANLGGAELSGMAAMAHIFAGCPVAHLYLTGSPRAVLARQPEALVLAKPFALPDLLTAIARAREQRLPT